MKNTSGYILALLLGIAFGWLAQQFWRVGENSTVASVKDIEYNERRIQNLRDYSDARIDSVKPVISSYEQSELGLALSSKNYDHASFLLTSSSHINTSLFPYIEQTVTGLFDEQKNFLAITLLYDLRLNIEPELESAYQSLTLGLIDKLEIKLEDNGRTKEIVEVFQLLVNLHADYVPYYLKLANWLIVDGELSAAEQTLDSVRHDINYSEELALLETILRDTELRKELIVVPLEKVGDHYLVNVTFPGGPEIKLMLDTGASMSVIKENLVVENWPVRLDDSDELIMNTANGNVVGRKLFFDKMSLDSINVEQVNVGVLALPGFQYDGLLGMNILKRFEFKIDQLNDVLLMKSEAQTVD